MEPLNHPFFFTWSAQRGARGIALTGGDGAYFTVAGAAGEERWLDLASFSYQVNAGHGRREIVEAIKRQADSLCVATPNALFPAKNALAERLLAMAPEGFSRVFFTLGGAEANENAIKIARTVTGRHKLVSRYRSYHGATMGALTLTGDWRRAPHEPGLPGVVHAMDCYCDRCPFGKTVDVCERECARHIDQVLELEGTGTVAAVILEPVPGANGVLVPPPEYWPMVRQACDRHGALLIADEVLTGFGRTGRAFAFEHFGVVPDIITVAKGLTGGYAPLGAVLVRDAVARHFDDHVLVAGLTSYAHPVGCAAALAALDVYERERLFERAAALGPVLAGALDGVRARLGATVVPAARSLGLLGALEVVLDPASWRALGAALDARRLYLHIDGRRGTVIFAPPLCIEEVDLRGGVEAFGDALAEIAGQ